MKKNVIEVIFALKSKCCSKEDKIREELKLSPAEFKGLISIEPGVIVPCKVLSQKMGLSVSRGSRVIEKLMKSGYMEEVKTSGDRRVVNITLAKKGINVQKKIMKILQDCEHKILKNFSKPELESLIASLVKVNEVLS
ncbi:MAG: MarR family winged helix-turn-helix transcriptional regulator [Ignavibacteriae bacterium]|nr:MarR family winged helix-turn-helix transcriptional regulator [Ignavibacteriota bacterium]